MAGNQMTSIIFQFEVVATEQYPADPATLGEVGRYVAQELRKMGYTVEPLYTGEKGGEFFEVIKQIAITAWENREFIAAVATGITSVIGAFTKVQQKQKDKRKEPMFMRVKMTNSEGNSLEIEGSDAEGLNKTFEEVKKQLPGFVEQSPKASKTQITAQIQQPSKRRRK